MQILLCPFSFLLSFVLTPAVIGLAWRIGAVDVPLDGRRMHSQSIPRAGGLAIYTAFSLACLAGGVYTHRLAVVLCGGGLMLLVGLADDIFTLSAAVKLFFQFAATLACVLAMGMKGILEIGAAVFWVMALTNAHNFIDGLDGLFAGCAAIEGAALFLTLILLGKGERSFPALLLCSACLGFRRFNRYPAVIFAGDCGSASVGFLLGLLSLPLFEGDVPSLSWLAPIFLFAYPLTDLFCAIFRRTARGKNPFAADRGHLHHWLYDAGLLQPQCVKVLLLITFAFSAVGVVLCKATLTPFAAFAVAALAFLLMRIHRFVAEFH